MNNPIIPTTLIRFKTPQSYSGVPPFQGVQGVMFTESYVILTGVVCDHNSPSHNNNAPWKICLAKSGQFSTHNYIHYGDEDMYILVLSPSEEVVQISAELVPNGVVKILVEVRDFNRGNTRTLQFYCHPQEATVTVQAA